MKKLLLLLTSVLSFFGLGYAQATFSTGTMDVDVSQYGRIRLYDSEGIRALERASILVGTSSSAVFDYTNDAEELEPTVLVASPTLSDFEIFGAYDNSYSGEPPAVIVELNAYGWQNESYTIVKFNVKNSTSSLMNAMIGLDIIPYLNEEYGYDSVTYNATAGVIRFHRGGQVNMGIKLLSTDLSSLYSFEWYDGYTVDSDYWTWMNYGSIQPQYVSNTIDGPVTITSQASIPIGGGETRDVYYALALGNNEASMLASIDEAFNKYLSWFSAVPEPKTAVNRLNLGKNYPNPFNKTTTIRFDIPSSGLVTLKVFDAVGNEAASLVNEKLDMGQHSVIFDAKNLSAGVYYYTLTFNNQVQSHKMFLVK